MNRSIAVALILASLILAGVGGYIVGAGRQSPADGDPAATTPSLQEQLLSAAPQMAMFASVGTLKPVSTASTDWAYPDARGLESSTMVEESIREEDQVVARTELGACNVISTPDDFETVVEHYVRQMQTLLPSNAGKDPVEFEERYHVGSRLHTYDSGVALVTDVAGDADPNDNRHDRRPLDVATLSLQAANCNVTIAISRGPDEDATYIHVIYNEWPVASEAQE